MPDPNEREKRYLEDTQDTVNRARQDQRETEHAGDNPQARTKARARQYMQDTRAAVRRSQQ